MDYDQHVVCCMLHVAFRMSHAAHRVVHASGALQRGERDRAERTGAHDGARLIGRLLAAWGPVAHSHDECAPERQGRLCQERERGCGGMPVEARDVRGRVRDRRQRRGHELWWHHRPVRRRLRLLHWAD